MAYLFTQTTRVNAERNARPPARPDVVALRYRLQPADLPDRQQVVVRTVVGQGIETLSPVLHFGGLAKPLVLDAANATAMAAMTGSPLFGDWSGCQIELRVVKHNEVARILLGRVQPQAAGPTQAEPALLQTKWRNLRSALLLVGILLLALTAVYLVDHWDEVLRLLAP